MGSRSNVSLVLPLLLEGMRLRSVKSADEEDPFLFDTDVIELLRTVVTELLINN